MRPGRPCKICSDPTLRAKVDALLQTGESYRAISALTGTDRFSIQRHKKHAFPPPVAEEENLSELELSERRLAELADQVRAQYASAVASGDAKVALDCSKVLSRLEIERHNRIVTRKQAEIDAPKNPEDDAGSPEFHDSLLRKFESLRQEQTRAGRIACPVCASRSPVDYYFPGDVLERMRRYLATVGYALVPAAAPATTEEPHDNSSAN
jgi:hypothetical protein